MANTYQINDRFLAAADIEAETPITVGAKAVGPDGKPQLVTNSWVPSLGTEEGSMGERGEIVDVNLSGIEFSSEVNSVTLHLVGMVPPYKNSRFECRNVYSFVLHRPPDDQIPYYVGELSWRVIASEEKQAALEKVKYPFFNQDETFFASSRRIVSVHMEGGVCGDILAENVMLIETPTGGGKPYRIRVDSSGNPIGPDDPGEFVAPLPGN